MLAQEEREAQLVVEQELEMGQNKVRDLTKKLTANITDLRRAKEQINGLLSQSQSLSFLQVGRKSCQTRRSILPLGMFCLVYH